MLPNARSHMLTIGLNPSTEPNPTPGKIIGYFMIVVMLLKIHYGEKWLLASQVSTVRRTLGVYAEDPGLSPGPVNFMPYSLFARF